LPEPRAWIDIAVLYRRHSHRELIIERLRRSGIPYVVVGTTGLFLQPEIRDLEAAMRVLADPTDSVSFMRMLTSGPWRLDVVYGTLDVALLMCGSVGIASGERRTQRLELA
jgi:superfamily I DNA/RNA helicase